MTDERPKSHQEIPRLRVPSYNFANTSGPNISNVTQRTVSSSSTSIISTPSNNIRRVKQKQAQPPISPNHGKHHRRDEKSKPSSSNTKKKLLNLLQLRKTFADQAPFVLHKPVNMSSYDFSVFSKPVPDQNQDKRSFISEKASVQLPPSIKDSRIKAWESAEKISSSIVFDNNSSISKPGDNSPNDSMSIDDDTTYDATVDEVSIDQGLYERPSQRDQLSGKFIRSIYGLTRGEFDLILQNYDKLQNCSEEPDLKQYFRESKSLIKNYAQQQNAEQASAFMSNHTLAGKRKAQILRKKELLHKLFGYANSVNQDFITNNTLHSSIDNSMNAQKAFHEDKEEMMILQEEQRAFEESMLETKQQLDAAKSSRYPPYADIAIAENSNLLNMTSSWLDSVYEMEKIDLIEEGEPEMVGRTISYLKLRVRDTVDLDDN